MDSAPTPDGRVIPDISFTRTAFAGATTIFVVFGTTASLYGPLLVTFAHRFGVSLPAAGAMVSVQFAGALCGVPLGWVGLQRRRGGTVLSGALATMALGTAGAALAVHFDELLASVYVIGLGFGAIDFSLNSLLVRDVAGAHRLSVANAGYGIGSVVGPLLVILARPAHYPLLFAAVGLAALALVASVRNVQTPTYVRTHPRAPRARRDAALGIFIAAYILYVATESSAATWIAPQLHRVGYSQTTGAVVTTGFWLCLAAGRFLAGPVHRRVSDRRLVLIGLAASAVMATAALADAVAPFAYPLAGLSLSLVYPMGLVWFTKLNPRDNDRLAILILTMMAGGVIGPATTGAAVSLAGVRAVPVCVAAFAAGDLALFLAARQLRT